MYLPAVARIPLVLLVAACSLAPATQPTVSPGSSATPVATPTSASPTERPSQSPAAVPNEEGDVVPPVATLSSGDVSVAGYPGSYCFVDTCADIGAWPPKTGLPELTASASNGDLNFEIADQVSFVRWSAAYGTSSDDDSTPSGEGGEPFDPDTGASPPPQFLAASLSTPPPGDWVVWVWVDLEAGDLSYAWHVIVP